MNVSNGKFTFSISNDESLGIGFFSSKNSPSVDECFTSESLI